MSRLSLKSTIPYFSNDGAVHFRMAGEFLSLEDVDGRIEQLMKLLDGSRDADEIFASLVGQFPDLDRAEFDLAIAELDASGLLQDAAADRAGFTDEQCERWSRNLGFFETYATLATSKYDFQQRIRDTKVAMLGLGGVGSHVLMDMLAIGFTDVRIVDFDLVELSNLNRQVLYGEHALGRSKIKMAEQWARRFHAEAKVEATEIRLGSADDVYDVVADRDIVVAAIDQPKTHALFWLNEGCVRAGAALLTGGVDTQRAMHFTIVPGLSGCVECWRAEAMRDAGSRELFARLGRQDDAGVRFGEDVAAFDGLVAMHSAFLVGEAVRLATAVSPPLSVGRMLQVLFHCPVLAERESWDRRPDCPVCAGVRTPARFDWLTALPRPSLRPQGIWPSD